MLERAMTAEQGAFDKLRAEHRVLLTAIDALERFVGVRDKSATAAEDFSTFLEFFRETEHTHHQKEERGLDPFLVKCGFAWDAGPLAQMRGFHDRERQLIRILQQAKAEGWPNVDPDKPSVLAALSELIASQRKHIELENTVVFPIAERKLDPEELAALSGEVFRFEREQCDPRAMADLVVRVRKLCERYP
jgi:hemerythrin-like domain-containing protein